MSSREIKTAALKLPPARRAALAEQLLASLDSDAQRSIDEAWSAEAESRISAFNAGKLKAKPLSQVLAKYSRRAKR